MDRAPHVKRNAEKSTYPVRKTGGFRLSTPTSTGFPAISGVRPMTASRVTPGIVHLGIGAFHRAHQAVVIDDLPCRPAPPTGESSAPACAVRRRATPSPRRIASTRSAVRSGAGTEHRIIGSVLACEVASENPAALIARLTDPATRIVSLTVTEKGYCHTPQTGDLDERHPDIVHDLQTPDTPRSAIGFLVAALARRRSAGVAPFTVLSLRQSFRQRPYGAADRDAVRRLAVARSRPMDRSRSGLPFDHGGPHRAGDHRRRPRRDFERARHARRLAGGDRAVHAMDRRRSLPGGTAGSRRPLACRCVSDVTPFEHMKLRLLNASHSALAYLGYLAGHETIAVTMTDQSLRSAGRGR